MTTFLLVRHASHDLIGTTLAGRMPGVRLNASGRREAARLASRLMRFPVSRIESSPQDRAVETAAIIATAFRHRVEVSEELDEIDFGGWTGRTFADLEQDPAWRDWNGNRAAARTPAGASMQAAYERVTAHMDRLAAASAGGCVVLVTHAEVIRTVVLAACGLSFDAWQQIDVPPASLTRVEIRAEAPHAGIHAGTAP